MELMPTGEVWSCFYRARIYVLVFASATVEDAATGKVTEGSHCNLCNRHKHVYCAALSHWREGSHYNHMRCCAWALHFVLCGFIMGSGEG